MSTSRMPPSFTLDPRRPYKPLDVGNGIISGTVSGGGRLLSVGITHPEHGRVVVTDAPAFAEAARTDQAAVRAYRAELADPRRAGFGFEFARALGVAQLLAGRIPVAIHGDIGEPTSITTFAPAGRGGIVQVVRGTGRPADVRWSGAMRLGRAAYTQLTEGGPLPVAPAAATVTAEGGVHTIRDPELSAAAAIVVREPRPSGSGWVAIAAISLAVDLAVAAPEALELADRAEDLLSAELAIDTAGLTEATLAERRAVHYALDCCATRAPRGTIAMLADHEILPLVWTRDAYFVCELLRGVPDPRAAATVEGFVRWLFEVAERPSGWWPRSSLASGQAKDRAFQLDQQLYPLLLAHRSGVFADACAGVLDRLLERRTNFGLIATDETPADDPLTQAYHFSSHVLLWHTLASLSHPAAGEVRTATLRHFAADGRFAYAVSGPDGAGPLQYHDANDFPTAFAPAWGFCAVDDPRWVATISFAWSTFNRGYVDGSYAGLGSLHTPHPWPLGDLQALIIGEQCDPTWAASARQRLAAVETWDRMLPEAYDEETTAVVSRHWFAWPVALRATLDRKR